MEDNEKELPETTETPAEEKLTVDLTEDDDAGDDTADEKQASPQDRKAKRGYARQMREALKDKKDEIETLRREMAELRGRVSAQPVYQPAPQYQPQEDPGSRELKSIRDQQSTILRAIQSQGITSQEIERLNDQWHELNDRRTEIISRRGQAPAAQGPSQEQIAGQILAAEFPEIYNDTALLKAAEAEMLNLTQRQRKPVSIVTAREALRRVADREGLGRKAPAPTAAQQSKYAAVSARAGANGAGSNTYTPDKNTLALARAYTKHLPNLDDAERVRKWVKEVGRPAGLMR